MDLALYFRHRSSMLLLLTWPVLVWALDSRAATRPELLLGTGCVAAAAGLRLAAARQLGRGARVHSAGARGGLVAAGPYALTRNPLYVSAGCALVGLSLAAGAGWGAFWLLPATMLVYTPVVRHEESVLRRSLGEHFAAYARSVPRWIGVPARVRGVSAARVPWREVFRRESQLVPGFALALVAIAWVGSGGLQVHEWLAPIASALHLSIAGLCGVGVSLGAGVNSVLIERKWRRREKQRASSAGVDAPRGNPPRLADDALAVPLLAAPPRTLRGE